MRILDADGGAPAFPTDGEGHYDGMSLRAYLASQETLSDLDHPEHGYNLAELIAEKPTTEATPTDQLDWLRWEAKARAALKVMRADALIAALAKSMDKEEQP